jgi:hypothetical protein
VDRGSPIAADLKSLAGSRSAGARIPHGHAGPRHRIVLLEERAPQGKISGGSPNAFVGGWKYDLRVLGVRGLRGTHFLKTFDLSFPCSCRALSRLTNDVIVMQAT